MARPAKPTPANRAARSKSADNYVALLRAINVGGKNKLPMADLVAICTDAGCTDVRTYIQSGNVVFSAKPAVAKQIAEVIANQIAERFGFRAPVVLRTAGEFREAAAWEPFLRSDADPKFLHVGFLADLPTKSLVDALDYNRSPGDSFAVRGREIYMHLAAGAADTKLTTTYFDSKLKTTSTFRNWRTVQKLLEMTETGS